MVHVPTWIYRAWNGDRQVLPTVIYWINPINNGQLITFPLNPALDCTITQADKLISWSVHILLMQTSKPSWNEGNKPRFWALSQEDICMSRCGRYCWFLLAINMLLTTAVNQYQFYTQRISPKLIPEPQVVSHLLVTVLQEAVIIALWHTLIWHVAVPLGKFSFFFGAGDVTV